MKRTGSAKKKQAPRAPTRPATTTAVDASAVPTEVLAYGVPLSADLELQRQLRLEALKAHVAVMFAQGRGAEAMDQVVVAMAELERQNEQLAWRVLRADRYRYGRRTEKLSPAQLKLLVLAFGGDDSTVTPDGEPAVPATAEPEQVEGPATETEPESDAPAGKPPKDPKKRKRVQSMKVGADVARNVTLLPVPDDERSCALCGREKKVFGHVDHERIRYEPARIVVDVERCQKMGCEACRKDVSVAPRENAPAVVRKVDGSLLAKLVAEKCVLGLPLDRQRRELQRLGLDCPDKTIQSYWSYTADLIEPVAAATLSLAFGKSIVGADDSHLRTLDKTAKNGTFRGHLWCFVGTDGPVGGPETIGYGYTPSWEATEISDWFSNIEGDIQCDGYAGYASEVEDEDGSTRVAVPSERRLGCGMHIRSKFVAALDARDARAAVPVKLFADLYLIEADCKTRGLDANARGEERRRRSLPLLSALDEWVDRTHPTLLPKSPLRRATTYAISQRAFFRRCFTDGRFEIDNGRVERRIRLFAVARRNFLFTGSPRGGVRLAAAFTLVDNCLALGIDPERYLIAVIEKIERGLPMRRLSELIPQNWAAEHPAEQRGK